MKRRWSKLGASRHLEMMLAFLMFFVFVTFLLVYIEPFKKSEEVISNSIFKTILDGFNEKFGKEVRRIFIKVSEDIAPEECAQVDVSDYLLEEVFVKPIGGAVVNNYGISGSYLLINVTKGGGFYAYFSEGFNAEGNFKCEGSVSGHIGSVKSFDVLFLDNDIDNYGALKEKWGVPSSVDFRIDKGKDFSFGKDVPKNTDIFARSYYFDVWDENEERIKTEEFLIRVWR